ncbi:hypothetical protein GMMP13_1650013 [Candidatus Magnetomoraceae bacterium gMMP-13]
MKPYTIKDSRINHEVLITYPLKQGLKLDGDTIIVNNKRVLITYPLKQGLKLHGSSVSGFFFCQF